MIEYIHVQLSIWGRWVRSSSSRGLGYSRVCPMFKDVRHGGVFGGHVPMGVTMDSAREVHDTDQAVTRLTAEQKRLCIEYYVIGGTGVEVAARVGCARQRLYERLHVLQSAVLGHLNDIVAGVPDANRSLDTGRTVSV